MGLCLLSRGCSTEDSLLLGAPGDVVWSSGCVVLINQLLYNLPGPVQLVKVILKDVLLPELLQEGLPLPQLVVLATGPLKELRVYKKDLEWRGVTENFKEPCDSESQGTKAGVSPQ